MIGDSGRFSNLVRDAQIPQDRPKRGKAQTDGLSQRSNAPRLGNNLRLCYPASVLSSCCIEA
jgi:hypothetical protein